MTPAGRWVARIRCRPSDRPRWATLTTPSTNSGTSWTSAANSSTTITRLGGASGSPRRSSSSRSLAFLAFRMCSRCRSSAFSEVSARRTRCGDRSVTRPTRVRQVDALGERGAALVVDEQEGQRVRAVAGGHAQHPRLQELALAGAGGAADQRVRALAAQVEGQRLAGRLADDRPQARGSALRTGPRRSAGDDGLRFPPPIDHRAGSSPGPCPTSVRNEMRPRQVRVVLDPHARRR